MTLLFLAVSALTLATCIGGLRLVLTRLVDHFEAGHP